MQYGRLTRRGRKRGPRCLAVLLGGHGAVWQTHLSRKLAGLRLLARNNARRAFLRRSCNHRGPARMHTKCSRRLLQASLCSLRRQAFHNLMNNLPRAELLFGRSVNGRSLAVGLHSYGNLVFS